MSVQLEATTTSPLSPARRHFILHALIAHLLISPAIGTHRRLLDFTDRSRSLCRRADFALTPQYCSRQPPTEHPGYTPCFQPPSFPGSLWLLVYAHHDKSTACAFTARVSAWFEPGSDACWSPSEEEALQDCPRSRHAREEEAALHRPSSNRYRSFIRILTPKIADLCL